MKKEMPLGLDPKAIKGKLVQSEPTEWDRTLARLAIGDLCEDVTRSCLHCLDRLTQRFAQARAEAWEALEDYRTRALIEFDWLVDVYQDQRAMPDSTVDEKIQEARKVLETMETQCDE
jgi:hypothetical protein